MNKEAKLNLICSAIFLAVVLVLSMYFVVGDVHVLGENETSRDVNYSALAGIVLNEDNGSNIFNFSINMSIGGGLYNLTEINISLFGAFTYNQVNTESGLLTGSNGTSNMTDDGQFGVYFLNTTSDSNTLSFYSRDANSYIIPCNKSTNESYFYFNLSAPNPGIYNFTLRFIYNNDSTIYNETNVSVRIKDTTTPQTANFSGFVNNGNYSGTISLTAAIVDNGYMSYTFFNLTNMSIDQNRTMLATNTSTNPLLWSSSFDTTVLTDGVYGITIWANDSEDNLNNTHLINVTIDNTLPSSVTITSSNDSRTSVSANVAAADALTSIVSCSVDRSKAVLTGTGTARVLREDNLVCGQSYPYVVTCSDHAGNSRSSATVTLTTDACSGGGGGGSGATSTYTWTNTYTTTDAQFTQGYTKQLSTQNRVRITVSGMSHHVGVKEVTATSATIEIASDPVEVNLDVGDDAKVDVTDDNFYDIYVKLNSIVDGKADVTIKKINEAIPEGEGAVATTGEIAETTTGTETGTTEDEEKSLTWLWIVLGILVLAAIIGGGVAAKRKK